MRPPNGEGEIPQEPLELNEILHIETSDGNSLPFEVVGILEDPESSLSYAVLHNAAPDGEAEFIVTDLQGKLLEDAALAQEILDDFLSFTDDGEEARVARNGETS
jgi:hypothetical protein